MYRRTLKRFLDLCLCVVALPLCLPVCGVVAALVWIDLRANPLFRQVRPGLDGRPFTMIKFRTMTDARGARGELLPDDKRLTRMGRILRSTSLDELPELWNVLRGDMSVVGPRPLRLEYLPLYTPEQHRRHRVRPGITGWAQVNGRNLLSWEEKFDLDVWYVDNCSLALDIKICFRTVAQVLLRTGISSDGSVTMPRFEGSPTERRMAGDR